jgi:predicted methyltransferase
MHRIKGTTPDQDTVNKIKSAKPTGRVLDTNTGLGYTAIYASRQALHVTTVELDPVVIAIARQNPWSRELFDNPKITQVIGDSFDVVMELEDGFFDCIIHDPPTMSLAGDLYAADFYAELLRVLKRRGRLFHYIGDPDSSLGKRTTKGVIHRLQEVGFREVRPAPQAFGVTAQK